MLILILSFFLIPVLIELDRTCEAASILTRLAEDYTCPLGVRAHILVPLESVPILTCASSFDLFTDPALQIFQHLSNRGSKTRGQDSIVGTHLSSECTSSQNGVSCHPHIQHTILDLPLYWPQGWDLFQRQDTEKTGNPPVLTAAGWLIYRELPWTA